MIAAAAASTCTIAEHEAIKRDHRWEQLEPAGVQPVAAIGKEPGYTLELRNCSCGSTLARAVRS